MFESIVKISKISINNFKNVAHGEVSLGVEDIKKSSILGIYGQNGSGKTAIIDSLEILKLLLSRQSIPSDYINYIKTDTDFASFRFGFVISVKNGNTIDTEYSFTLKKNVQAFSTNDNTSIINARNDLFSMNKSNDINQIYVCDEVITYNVREDSSQKRTRTLINTRDQEVFGPQNKYDVIIKKEPNIKTELKLMKKICFNSSRSFVFSSELISKFRTNDFDDPEMNLCLTIYESLLRFVNEELFIINSSNNALVSLGSLPLSFKYKNKDRSAYGSVALSLNSSSIVPADALSLIQNIISSMNIVLKEIIPGLTIDIKVLASELMENGESGKCVELVSLKNLKEIPLKYESEGIIKIISILQLLIVMFNDPSITVAIDELDSGIFEYLLGELLKILSDKGKGQLIFTSHNLRPLETLNKKQLIFTTVDPNERYMRMTNVKANNNMRDFYYRSIILGGQKEVIYSPTNNFEITLAFRKARKK